MSAVDPADVGAAVGGTGPSAGRSTVQTAIGLIDRADLEVTDIVSEGFNDRTVATEWRHNGELVRRDVHVAILQGQAIFGDAAAIG